MSRFKTLIVVPLLVSLLSPLAVRASSSSLVISELQTGSATSTGQEFVELYNPTATAVVVDGWLLQYKSATSAVAESSWSKRATLAGTVAPYGFYLISQKSYLANADADLSTAGLSGTGGHIRLKDKAGNVVDLVGWGDSANASETAPASAPPAGQSLERLPGRLIEDGGNSTDTDDNSKDFVLRATPGPQSTSAAPEDPALAAPIVTDDPPADDQPAPAPQVYEPVLITELLPDPATPLTDAHDEFIELYNPNADAVNVEGYTLQAGANFRDFYNLPAETIAPGAYLVILASESHISLINTGTVVQLLDPDGKVVSLVDNYGKAATGESWSLIDGTWKWSLEATAGSDNVFVAPLLNPTTTKPKTTSTTTAAKPKATTVPKSTTKAAKAPVVSKAAKAKTAVQTALVAAASTHSAAWLLIGLALVSIGYAIYEFRHDVRNYYHISKRYLKTRRGSRPPA